MAIRAATVFGRRKDFGGARILAARNERRGPCHAVVCPSVRLSVCLSVTMRLPQRISTKFLVVVRVGVRHVYLWNQPNRSRYG